MIFARQHQVFDGLWGPWKRLSDMKKDAEPEPPIYMV